MAHYNCLLFDVDGTLLDFHAAEHAALRDTLVHFQFPDIEAAAAQYQEINTQLWATLERGEVKQEKLVVQRFLQLMTACGMHGDAAKVNEYYLTQLGAHADMLPGADETLKELAEVATLAVVSNGVERVQLDRLETSGLGAFFDGVFVSGRVGAAKPARKIFDTALQSLGVENKEKVLVIGDSLKADIAGGKNAGLSTCWCNFEDMALPEGAPQPTYTIRGFEELLHIVMEQEELNNVGSPEKRHQLPVV